MQSRHQSYKSLSLYIYSATIFAREILEGCIIIGQYRTVIMRSPDFQEETKQKKALRAVTMAALAATALAVLIAGGTTIGLYFAGKQMSNATAEIIEGVSKIIAAICVLQLSAKVPKWLGLYFNPKSNDDGVIEGLDERSIKFNVAWNLWREVAECGIFLIPYMLGSSARSIPISAVVGTVIGFAGGWTTYYVSQRTKDAFWLAFFLANITAWLAIGLFTGGCHEFEEVLGMTPYIWKIDGTFWSHNHFPMVLLKPFGYSHKRTVLQFVTFWFWISITIGYHYYKYNKSEKQRLERESLKTLNANDEESQEKQGDKFRFTLQTTDEDADAQEKL